LVDQFLLEIGEHRREIVVGITRGIPTRFLGCSDVRWSDRISLR
jgi:hypothetical protein